MNLVCVRNSRLDEAGEDIVNCLNYIRRVDFLDYLFFHYYDPLRLIIRE